MLLYSDFFLLHQLQHLFIFFFFNDTATTEIYTLSLHDALPIFNYRGRQNPATPRLLKNPRSDSAATLYGDRKSTRLNSSHGYISYAVFCLKKKNNSTRRKCYHTQ